MPIPTTSIMYSCKYCYYFFDCKRKPIDNFLMITSKMKNPNCFVNYKIKQSEDQIKAMINKKKKKRKTKK